jgi:D-alanyl-D-alanine carboxypeptidase
VALVICFLVIWICFGFRISDFDFFLYAPAMKLRIPGHVLLSCLLLAAYPARADRVDDYVKGEMAKHRIPGVALRIVQNGKATKTAAYGRSNLELNVPVKPETVFEIGSITKQFTAAGILLLVQDGKLSVEDKLSQHLKETPDTWKDITVRHLLTHTSGLKSYTGLDGFELTKHLTQRQFIAAIAAQPLEFQPGESWKYCNTGFNLLGYVIENVSGTNYWHYMSRRVFRPLGMNRTTNRLPSVIIPDRASGYEQANRVWINRDYDLTDVFAAGALVSTIGDLAKWNAALDGDQLLSAGTKTQMWTPAHLNNGKPTKYGYAWFIDSAGGHLNIGHGGATSGFSASIQRFPDDHLAVIILTNTDEAVATPMAVKIASFYLASAGK